MPASCCPARLSYTKSISPWYQSKPSKQETRSLFEPSKDKVPITRIHSHDPNSIKSHAQPSFVTSQHQWYIPSLR